MIEHVHVFRRSGLKADDGYSYLDHCECGEIVETPRCNNWFRENEDTEDELLHWCERNPEHSGTHRCGELGCVGPKTWTDEQGNWLYE